MDPARATRLTRQLAESRDLLADCARDAEREAAIEELRELELPPLEDPMVPYRARQAELAAARERAKAQQRASERRILAARAAASEPEHDTELEDTLGQVVASERVRTRQHVAKLEGELRAEIAAVRTEAKASADKRSLDLRTEIVGLRNDLAGLRDALGTARSAAGERVGRLETSFGKHVLAMEKRLAVLEKLATKLAHLFPDPEPAKVIDLSPRSR